MAKTAIILGSTGLTGGFLLEYLLEDIRYSEIRVFNRRSLNKQHSKLKEYIVDLLDPDTFETNFYGDEVFCCIGTTASKTADKTKYKAIDFGIPDSVAKLCKKHNIKTFLVMSSLGANSKSPIFYNRIKGEMEDAVMRQDIEFTYIVQPSLIGGKRAEKRMWEFLGKLFTKVLRPFLFGPLKKYRIVHPKTIARAMISLANAQPQSGIYKSDVLKTWSNSWQ